jgi:hypothetical protein
MKVAEIKGYTTHEGCQMSFVTCPFDRLAQIAELKLKINELQ